MDLQAQLAEKDRTIQAQQQQIYELTDKMDKIKLLSEEIVNDSFEKENQLKIRTAECTKYMNENAELRRALEQTKQEPAGPDSSARIQAIQEEKGFLEALAKQIEDEKADMTQDFEKKVAFLESERDKLQKSTSELEARIGSTAELEQKILVVNKNNDMLLQEKRNLQQQLIKYERKSKQWENLDDAVDDLEQKIHQLEDERDDFQKKLRDSEDIVRELTKFEDISKSLEEERAKLIERHETKLKASTSESSVKIESLASEKDELATKLDQVEAQARAQSKQLGELKDFQERSSELQQKLQNQDAIIQKLKEQTKLLDSLMEKTEVLQKSNQDLQFENEDLKQKVSEYTGYKSELDALKEKHAEVVDTLERYQGKSSRVIELENQTKNLMDINLQLEEQLKSLQQDGTVSTDSIFEMKKINKELENQNVRILKENSRLKDELQKSKASVEDLKREITSQLKGDISTSKSALKKISVKSEDQTRQITGLTDLNRTLSQENDDLKLEVNKQRKIVADYKEIKSGFESLKDINFKLEDEKDELNKKVSNLNRQVKELTVTAENFKKLKETYSDLEKKDRDLENTNRSLQIQLKDMNTLKDGFESLKTLNTELEDKNKELKKQFSTAQRKLDQYVAANYESRVEELESKAQELQDSIKFKDNELSVKDQQLSKMHKLEADYQKAMSENNSLEVKINSLELRLGKVSDLEAKLVNLQDTRTGLMQDKSKIESESALLRQKINQLERQMQDLDYLKQKNQQIEDENMSLKTKVKRLTLQLESLQ